MDDGTCRPARSRGAFTRPRETEGDGGVKRGRSVGTGLRPTRGPPTRASPRPIQGPPTPLGGSARPAQKSRIRPLPSQGRAHSSRAGLSSPRARRPVCRILTRCAKGTLRHPGSVPWRVRACCPSAESSWGVGGQGPSLAWGSFHLCMGRRGRAPKTVSPSESVTPKPLPRWGEDLGWGNCPQLDFLV